MLINLIVIVIGYLLGSISTSVILSKLNNSADPRTVGSGNAGATNVLRTKGKKQALIVLIVDILKGALAIFIGHVFHVSDYMLGFVGFAAVFGHVFPIFYGFRGGKGVATALGVLLALSWPVSICCIIVWLVITIVTRYVSLASIIAMACAPLLAIALAKSTYCLPLLLIAALVIVKHAANIKRLKNGNESKINWR